MENIQRNGWGAILQAHQTFNIPPTTIPEASTLNKKHNVQVGVMPEAGQIPRIAYIAISNKGHAAVLDGDGSTELTPIPSLPRHAGMYNHIPFVMKPLDNDLTVAEMAKYRMRTIEEHGGVMYACYYLKCIDFTNVVPKLVIRRVANGVTTEIPFVPSLQDLSPVPPDVSVLTRKITTGEYLVATVPLSFTMSKAELNEFLNACEIRDGHQRRATISKLALVSGVDKLITATVNGQTAQIQEAIAAQVTNFISVFFPVGFGMDKIDLTIDAGATEPMFDLVADDGASNVQSGP